MLETWNNTNIVPKHHKKSEWIAHPSLISLAGPFLEFNQNILFVLIPLTR